MAVTIYHNPKCSKSRAALELLSKRGVPPAAVAGNKAALGRPPENVLKIF